MAKSSFTLDDIRAAADEKFGGTEIAGVELRNVIRLDKEERAALKAYQEKAKAEKADDDNEDIDEDAIFNELFELVEILVGDPQKSAELRKALCDSKGRPQIDLLQVVIEKYTEDQKAGKASPSQS